MHNVCMTQSGPSLLADRFPYFSEQAAHRRFRRGGIGSGDCSRNGFMAGKGVLPRRAGHQSLVGPAAEHLRDDVVKR